MTTTSTGLMSPAGMGFGTPSPAPSAGYSPGNRQGFFNGGNRNFGGPGFSRSSDSATSGSSDAKPAVKKPSRFLSAKERLPKGLPDWFLEKEVDGQVTMAQYATNWDSDTLERFSKYDLNGDGIITADECLKVVKGKPSTKSTAASAEKPASVTAKKSAPAAETKSDSESDAEDQ
jgi:hypothetical protein